MPARRQNLVRLIVQDQRFALDNHDGQGMKGQQMRVVSHDEAQRRIRHAGLLERHEFGNGSARALARLRLLPEPCFGGCLIDGQVAVFEKLLDICPVVLCDFAFAQ